ncbi:hypothetical protein AB0F20_30680 [Streptomyces goshikiensis]|uniref:hypothetical protein n=1 Tax=Streptomyces goshikiensis TaxID=1942 RepID=UPI003408CD8E
MNMTRRGLMRRGAGLAAAGAAGLGLPAQAAAAAPVDNPARVPAGTALINVAADSSRWQAGVANQGSSTTLQGIAFDSANGHFYTLQVAGASQIAYLRSGSQAAVTASIGADVHAESGDLCLTRHDIATGAVNGYMYLLGFGHGVSLGVQPASGGNPAYVWTEAGSLTDPEPGRSTRKAEGARAKWSGGPPSPGGGGGPPSCGWGGQPFWGVAERALLAFHSSQDRFHSP